MKGTEVRKPSLGGMPWIGRQVALHRRSFFVRKVAGVCRRYLSWFANVDYDMTTNGELFVLEMLARLSPKVIFDAGANLGDWTRAARALCPEAAIHAFEISPPTFDKLAERNGGLPNVILRNAGLDRQPGRIVIRHYDGLEALTTATGYPHPFPYREIEAEVISGAGYAAEAGIDRIDFLKIDVEGMEEAVLLGFDPLLREGRIKAVQFEYGRASIVHGFLLRDFHAFFRDRGYRVGKIFPSYVDFREYEMDDENFLGPNYLACHESATDYIGLLRAQS